ncbi:winged helix-turn-helix transcriptional regulator [Parasphingopyxis marina]|nr:helix-turn-helix domain-containing protein [Parasphingopyxis marina]
MGSAERKRWYDDACGTAFALDMIGERWSILIMRELMFGPRRFNELRADLPGISANILTQRLERLEDLRILKKRKLPPPASAQVYELTQWGYEAEPITQVLGKWATRHPDHDPTLPLSAASIMMSFRTMIDADRAKGFKAKIGFRFGEDGFVVTLDGGELITERREPDDVDLLLACEPTVLAALVYGGQPAGALEKAGALAIEGDGAVLDRFVTLFPLPEKLFGED